MQLYNLVINMINREWEVAYKNRFQAASDHSSSTEETNEGSSKRTSGDVHVL